MRFLKSVILGSIAVAMNGCEGCDGDEKGSEKQNKKATEEIKAIGEKLEKSEKISEKKEVELAKRKQAIDVLECDK